MNNRGYRNACQSIFDSSGVLNISTDKELLGTSHTAAAPVRCVNHLAGLRRTLAVVFSKASSQVSGYVSLLLSSCDILKRLFKVLSQSRQFAVSLLVALL